MIIFQVYLQITVAFGMTLFWYLLAYSVYGLNFRNRIYGYAFSIIMPVLSIMAIFTVFMWFIAFVYGFYTVSTNFLVANFSRVGKRE